MLELFLFLLLMGGRRSGDTFSFPASPKAAPVPAASPIVTTPAATPAAAPSSAEPATTKTTPNVRPTGYGVAPGTRPGPGWTAYIPTPAEVIRNARSVLNMGVLNLIGPDPERPGKRVFYQREFNPNEGPRGHTRVTAWKERA